MKFFSIVTLLLIIAFIPMVNAGNVGTIVFVQDGIGELQKPEKQITIMFWDKYFNKSVSNFSVSSSITTMSSFMGRLNKENIDYVLLDGSNFIHFYKALESRLNDEAWLVQRTENNFEEFVLLVREDANINQVRQLKNTVFSLHSGYGLLRLYLEQLIAKTSSASMTDFFKEIQDAKTESQAILDVFFSKSDACLVARHVFEDAKELNPAIGKKLKIIHHSTRIYAPAIYFALNSASKKARQNFYLAVEMLNNTVRGRQILDLFGIHIIKRIDSKELEPLLQHHIAWQK